MECFALHVDDLSLALRAWRAMARDSILLLPECAPYPGPLSSPLCNLAQHSLKSLLPHGLESAWLKCEGQLPLSQSLSDRGMAFAVLKLISDAMVAVGMAHVGQPLKKVERPATRAWICEHQLMIRGPSRDALAAIRVCRALGLPTQVLRQSDSPQHLQQSLLHLGEHFRPAEPDAGAHAFKRHAGGVAGRRWWLDTTESFAALRGYACAALELKQQLLSQDIHPSVEHPLLVLMDSGNCLGAAGLARGLKTVFGPYVRIILVEDPGQLRALPTLRRWPKDPEDIHLSGHSDMGTHALLGVVDAVITVDASHRYQAGLALPADLQPPLGVHATSLLAAAAEHLSRPGRSRPHLLLWPSDGDT